MASGRVIKPLTDELMEILAALKIHSYAAFSFRGVEYSTNNAQGGVASQGALRDGLRNVLYSQAYTRHASQDDALGMDDAMLLDQLSRATPTLDRWDAGWSVYQVLPDRLLVQKGERSRAAVSGGYAANHLMSRPPQVGDVVSLRVYPGSASLQQGFYYVFSDVLSDQFDEADLLRFYFHVKTSGAVDLLNAVASGLNRFQVPFSYKTLSNARAYVRADAAVLYVAKRYYTIVLDVLGGLPQSVVDGFREETPLFTYPLLKGVGLAEEPRTRESFGMHRCRLLAEGVVQAWEVGNDSLSSCLQAVEDRFALEGLRLDWAWLNPGSVSFLHAELEERMVS